MSAQKNSLEYRISSIPLRYFKKVAIGQIVLTLIFILAISLFARVELKKNIILDTEKHLSLIQEYLVSSFKGPDTVCKSHFYRDSKYRITLIKTNGKVFCDNHKPAAQMDIHDQRPEFLDALKDGVGKSIRFSATLDEELVYLAKKVHYGAEEFIVRVSIPLQGLKTALGNIDMVMLMIFLPLFVLLSLLTLYYSTKMAFPLRSLMEKLNRIRDFTPQQKLEEIIGPDDDWSLIESTLIHTEESIRNYTESLYLENEKLGKILRSISDGIIAVNKDQKVILANDPFMNAFVSLQTNKEEIKKYKLIEILRAADGQELFEKALLNGKTIRSKQVITKSFRESEKLYFDLTVTPLKDAKGTVVGAVGVFHDITDSRRNAQIREDFVTNVGHEVKTPLTALKGYFQILQAQVGKNELFGKIDRNIERLSALFSDILNLSVIESKTVIEKSWMDTEPLTSMVISNVQQNYPNKKMNISSSYEEKAVYAHPLWIDQILTNLIDNAYKYGRPDGKISIEWKGNEIETQIIITDNGMGIAKEHLPRLFERFYRVDASRSRELGGTGLGLAIVKHIVQKHRGTIQVNSEIDKGTSFRICLPKEDGPQ